MSAVKTSVTELPESRVRVEAEVAPEEVERRVQQAAKVLGNQLRIPGFRKGKVPPAVVVRRLGREAVLDEALRSSIGTWYVDAIDAAALTTVGEPDLNVGDLPAEGQPLTFTFEIGVLPVAKLGDYKGIEVGRREPAAADEAIEKELESMRERFATLETVERAAETGDHIVMDYLGKIDGEPFDGGEGRDQLLELGSGRLIDGFEEQLVGAAAGDERLVSVTFPEDYSAEHLAGKAAVFDVTLKEVKHKRLPELDDEFAENNAGFDSIAELRDDISERLRHADEHAVEREYEAAVLDAVIAAAAINVPAQLVHARAHEMVENMLSSLAHQGISKEAYLRITGKDEHELATDAEPEASDALKRDAVIAAVIAAEQISPSDDELLDVIRAHAESEGETPEKVFERLRKQDRLERLREDHATRQAVEFLVSSAKPISLERAAAREKIWTPES
jgi:trigger factor